MLVEITLRAVNAVADLDNNVNLNFIKVKGKVGGTLKDTELVHGVVVDLGPTEMTIEILNAKIAMLRCNIEDPVPLTKHRVDIVERFGMLHDQEQNYFAEMITKCKDIGATLAIFQWGSDKDVSFLVIDGNLPVIRCVDNVDFEFIATATGATIVPRFQDLSPGNLGKAGSIRNKSSGTKDQMLYIEQCSNKRAVTIFVRGGTDSVIQSVKDTVGDALCIARNIFPYNSILCGAESTELSCVIALETAADSYAAAEKDVIRSFACAIDAVPVSFTKNNSLPSSHMLNRQKSQQAKEHAPHCNIDDKDGRTYHNEVLEALINKRKHQIIYGTAVVKKVFKIGLYTEPAGEGPKKGKAAHKC